MADYTWKQWEQTQDNDNVINNAACLRWQAGIELAGGSWSGSFEDGKDSITIDEFNALESQIQSKVSSYTPKNYNPDSTVQIVPGVDGWNKVEDGILKAVCEPDGVNRNLLRNTKTMQTAAGIFSNSGGTITRDENGEGTFTMNPGGTCVINPFCTFVDATDHPWEGQQIAISCDIFCEDLMNNLANIRFAFSMYGSNNGSSWTRKCYSSNGLSTSTFFVYDTSGLSDGAWGRVTGVATVRAMDAMTQVTETEYAMYRYSLYIQNATALTVEVQVKEPKLELASEATAYVVAPEDYGYPDATALSATPQSVEESDEVAAPEAEEIE